MTGTAGLSGWAALGQSFVIRFLAEGLGVTLKIGLICIVISAVLGTLLGVGRYSGGPVIGRICTLYIETVRNLPMIQIILAARFFSKLPVLWAGIAGIALFVSALIAEIVRGGLKGVDQGQWEAAYSQGMRSWQVMGHIVLPQALRKMIPPIVSQFITVIKDTSFVWIIGVDELTGRGTIIFSKYNNPFHVFFIIGVTYFAINYSISLFARRLERRLAARSF